MLCSVLPFRDIHDALVPSSSFSSSSLPSSSSENPSASRPSPRIPKLRRKPTNVMPPKTPKAKASPLGLILVAAENKAPDRKGPTARPAADSVCARPLIVPRTEWFGAELVIFQMSAYGCTGLMVGMGMHTRSNALVRHPTADIALINNTSPNSKYSHALPLEMPPSPRLASL